VIRFIGKKPEFRIVPGIHDEAVIGLVNLVQALQFLILAEE
jgi:hypothetical protein